MEKWSAVIITCSSSVLATCVEEEVKCLQKKGSLPTSLPVLTVEDPAENIGSGAATINGLLVAAEYLSVQKNYSVINADVLSTARVVILHQGRDCIYSSCGKSLITVPQKLFSKDSNRIIQKDVSINLELLLKLIGKLSESCPPGVWVCSTDMSLIMSEQDAFINWRDVSDVALFSVQSDVKYAIHHGCVTTNKDGIVDNIIYCGSLNTIQTFVNSDGCVPIVSGLVFMSAKVAESLLSLYSVAPLESCTYIGLDSGAEPVQVSFFFDILMAMASNIQKNEFLSGKYGKTYNINAGYCIGGQNTMVVARSLIWKSLSKFKMTSVLLRNCRHFYWTHQHPVRKIVQNLVALTSWDMYHCSFKVNHNPMKLNQSHLIINSIISVEKNCDVSSGVVIWNCELLFEDLSIGENCYLFGISSKDLLCKSFNVPKDTVLLSFCLQNLPNQPVIAIFGIDDNLYLDYKDSQSTFLNKPWRVFLERFSLKEDDIWNSSEESTRSLINAKLYTFCDFTVDFLTAETLGSGDILKWKNCQRYSLFDLLCGVDYSQRMAQKRKIYSLVTCDIIKRILVNNEDCSLLHYFSNSNAEGWTGRVMESLDSVLLEHDHYIVRTRTLSAMADLLGLMAGKTGGLRTGPGSNKSWSTAFKYLSAGEMAKGMLELKEEREKWLGKPRNVMRAARHYERAAQLLIQNCLKATKMYIKLDVTCRLEIGSWIHAECPARIDLQGGWSDTPPICYELGGSVVNVAVLIDNKKPIFAKACRKDELNIELIFGDKDNPMRLLIQEKSQILDFDQPFAQGALLKAALICADIIDLNSDDSLVDQLLEKCKSGLEIHSHSCLPQGCGMGTSSILAGAIIAVLWSAIGKQFDKYSVVHAVLHIEQLLTTGGGWQDQVGGIMGGINRGTSHGYLPLQVQVNPINVPQTMIDTLNQHLILIYTGKVRLAKNILQNVIRNWYARDFAIVNCFKKLLSASIAMEEAILKGDMFQIGMLLNQYWQQKKLLAPGCEPSSVKLIMDVLSPLCHGQLLVGAGGGGFMCVLTKKPNFMHEIKLLASSVQATDEMTYHFVSIDSTGLTLHLQ